MGKASVPGLATDPGLWVSSPEAFSYTCHNSLGPVFSRLNPGHMLRSPLRRGGMGQFPEVHHRAVLFLSLQPLSSLCPHCDLWGAFLGDCQFYLKVEVP